MPRRRLLHAIHDFLPRHCAGSEIYAARLCQELAPRHDVTVLCAEFDPAQRHGATIRRRWHGLPVVEVCNNWAFPDFAASYASPELGPILARLLDEERPDVLHLHSLLNLSVELPELAAARHIPVVMTLHDHHLFCPAGGQRVHIAEQHVCDEVEPDRCARCFAESALGRQLAAGRALRRVAPGGLARHLLEHPVVRRGLGWARAVVRQLPAPVAAAGLRLASTAVGPGEALTAADVERRLERVRRSFGAIDLFVAPSAALGEEHARLGLPREKLVVSDYGFRPFAAPPMRPERERLTIGFVGTLVWHKGVHVLLEAARRLPPDRFSLKVFGALETFPDYTARLRELARGLPVELMGGFAPDAARGIYEQLDVLVVPSLWPENSPLVIHEAAMTGVPVVGARAGGIVGLVRDGENGFLYDPFSPAALARCLAALIDDRRLLARFRGALPAVKSIAADAVEWEGRYEQLLARRPA